MVRAWRGRLFLDTVNFKIWSGGLIPSPAAVAAEGATASAALGGSSGAGKASPSWERQLQGLLWAGKSPAHTGKRERKEALPAWTIHPGHLQTRRWQAVVLPRGQRPISHSPDLAPTECSLCPYWLRSLKQTGRRNCPLLPESHICSARVKQCRESGFHMFSSGNYHHSCLSLVPICEFSPTGS